MTSDQTTRRCSTCDAWSCSCAKEDEEELFVVSGPFSLPLNGKQHYEWDRDIGWRVVKRDR